MLCSSSLNIQLPTNSNVLCVGGISLAEKQNCELFYLCSVCAVAAKLASHIPVGVEWLWRALAEFLVTWPADWPVMQQRC